MSEPRRGVPDPIDFDGLYKAIGKRDCPEAEMVRWVFDHAGVHPNRIPLDDWPCYGAVRLLAHAGVEYKEFLQIWAKLLPNQTQLKLQERTKDDGRVTVLLDAMEEELFGKQEKQDA